jgi:hypothetical protein
MADSGTYISSSVSYQERSALRPFLGLPCKSPVRLIPCKHGSAPDHREFHTTPKKLHRDGANCVKQSSLSARLELRAEIAKFAAAFDFLSYAERVSVIIDRLEAIEQVLRGTKGNT